MKPNRIIQREMLAVLGRYHCDVGLRKLSPTYTCWTLFAHQIKRCRGACVGLESHAQHALRLKQALSSMRTLPWPFKGRIGIRETSIDGERAEMHVIDRWCYVRAVRSEQELYDLTESKPAPVFDVDTYKINELLRPKGRGIISE